MSVRGRPAGILFLMTAALLLSPFPAETQEPEKLDIPMFQVQLADGKGTARKTFSGGEDVYVDLRFTLALSASDRYATTIIFIEDAGGTMEPLFVPCMEFGKGGHHGYGEKRDGCESCHQ